MSVFVVIPAYQEGENIGPVVREIFSLYPQFKVAVVDDGSNDATAQKAEEAGAKVLRHLVNRGQGAALKTGTDYVLKQGAEIIVHFDADRQFDPREIQKIIEPIEKGETEVVLGSRFLKDRKSESGIRKIPFSKKYLLLPLARLINLLFTGLWLSDAHNGFRALSRRAAELIEINQSRMAHNSEIVRQIKERRLAFKEIPVLVYYHNYGQGIAGGFKIIKDLILGKIL